MLYSFISKKIEQNLGFAPTVEQKECIECLAKFYVGSRHNKCFLLKGYAGTGKTSVVGALVKTIVELEQSAILLAPTGRAAKVFANYAESSATSIHKKIYKQKTITDTKFVLDHNKQKNTVFIVDEASMIANSLSESSVFGSGRLLDDLVEYVYSGDNCSIIFLGDTAQLLPVEQDFSPALDKKKLESFSLEVEEFTLTEVVRQSSSSGILANATTIRNMIDNELFDTPKIDLKLPDVHKVHGNNIIDNLYSSFGAVGDENTIVITRSNKRAKQYNTGIRNQVLQREAQISNSDLVMIVKNNYYWAEKNGFSNLNFIANGDIARVVRLSNHHEMYGFNFVDATLNLIDYDIDINCKILLESLATATPKENEDLGKKLFLEVEKDYAHIGNKRKKYLEMRKSEYLNSIQIKFSYAVTCHKAQGGQWQHVYIDYGYLTAESINKEFLQWLYTAFTRATTTLFLVNFKDDFF